MGASVFPSARQPSVARRPSASVICTHRCSSSQPSGITRASSDPCSDFILSGASLAAHPGRRPGFRKPPRTGRTSQKKEPDLAMRSGSESAAACAAPCHIISIRSAPQQVFLRGPQPSNRPERAPRRASRRAPPPRTPAPRWGRCRGCRAGRMPDRKESRA